MMTRREMIATLGALAVAMPAFAADDTFKGEMVCAKCYLKKPDAKECQDVLLVTEKGATTEFYITKNQVSIDSGEACTDKVPATVVGAVSEKDGRKWITATKITKQKT
jgi:non-ribosomal peptide synthetase component E (peptide arylation enzyme)